MQESHPHASAEYDWATLLGVSPIRSNQTAYKGVDQTMKQCQRLVMQARGDSRYRNLAMKITADVEKNPSTNHPDMRRFDLLAGAIYDWMKYNIIYTRDPYMVERLQSPDVTLRVKSGDCDDMAILGAALLESLGIPVRFHLTGNAPGQYSHIFIDYKFSGTWHPFDVTLATYAGDRIPESSTASEKVMSVSLDGSAEVLHDSGSFLADTKILGHYTDDTDEGLGSAALVLPAVGQIISEGRQIVTGADLKAIRAQRAAIDAQAEQARMSAANNKIMIYGGLGIASIITLALVLR